MAEPRVVIVGGGQAGLAVSQGLTAAGIAHEVLERARIAQSWRGRWDSFTLVTPNWTLDLPGHPYAGDDPEGHVPRDEIVRYLERFAESFQAPVREGVEVRALEPAPAGPGFRLRTNLGEIAADHVVIATGAYQTPHRPAVAIEPPPHLFVIDSEDYTNPGALPPGRVLVVGSAQTGCQLADELQEAGRDVLLACGRAPWGPRRTGGRDIVTWLGDTPWFDMTLADLPSPQARLGANIVLTGRHGGYDLDLRVLQKRGVELAGHLVGIGGGRAAFAPDLAQSVAFGDARYTDMRGYLIRHLPSRGLEPPDLPDPEPFACRPPEEVKLDAFGSIIFTSGFRPDYKRWVAFDAFDAMGYPLAEDGVSTVVPGLYFAGVHFLRNRKSSLLFGVGEDAGLVARAISGRLGAEPVLA